MFRFDRAPTETDLLLSRKHTAHLHVAGPFKHSVAAAAAVVTGSGKDGCLSEQTTT